MNCLRAEHQFSPFLHDELSSSEKAILLGHLAQCEPCRSKLTFERLLRDSLRALPAPTARAGFFDQAISAARSQGGRAYPSILHRFRLAGALAASITLCATLGYFTIYSTDVHSIAQVDMAVHEVKTVTLQFNAPQSFDKVTLSLKLPDHVEVDGYPGQREIRWETSLQKGLNMLSLPMLATRPLQGMVVASIEGKEKTKSFKISLNARPAQSSGSDLGRFERWSKV